METSAIQSIFALPDITIIILIGRESVHIPRCLERLSTLVPRKIVVVESQKGDESHKLVVGVIRDIGRRIGSHPLFEDGQSSVDSCFTNVSLVWHDWPGLQSVQFNWALDNLKIDSAWIMRLDADEYLTPETIERLKEELPRIPENVAGLTLELKRRFCGGEIRHATNGIRQVRLFRRGKARYEESLMDERLIVDGEVIDFDGAFYDDNLNSMDWWREKHRGYAKREAKQALEGLRTGRWTDPRKAKYYRLPPYLRAVAYFCLRYFLKGGFLDGYAGWMWNFWQGLWYRWIVDREIGKLRRAKKV